MVPNGWEIRQLAEVCSKPISYGIVQTGEVLKDGIPCARVVDLSKNEFDISEMIKTTEEIHQSYKKTILEKGELMMALRGEIGLVRIVPDHLVGINITRGIARLAPKNNVVDSECLLWIMRSNQVVNDLKRKAGGSALQEISLTALRKVKVAVPPLPEQRKIAKILGTWDKAINTTERLIDNSKQQKKALMQHLLTGKKRLLDDSGKPFEGEWEEVKVGSLITKHSEKTDRSGQYPVLTSSRKGIMFQSDYYNDRDVASEDNTGYNVVPRGFFTYRHMSDDLVFKFNINTICDRGIVSTLYPVFAAKENKVIPYFLQSILNEGNEFKRFSLAQKQGGSRTYMYLSKLNDLKIYIPNLNEQKKIVTILTNADQEIDLLEQQLADLKKEKKALMQQLLTGKRRVKVDEKEVV